MAGRRIDAAEAETPRFPPENARLVERQIDALFERESATAPARRAGEDAVGTAITYRSP